jgi:hypothetical protein
VRNSNHATIRSQQRGIPPLILELLDDYGTEEHVGAGCTVRYFDKKAIRRMGSAIGRVVVARLAPWHDCYKVVSSDGCAITIAHRFRHLRRK